MKRFQSILIAVLCVITLCACTEPVQPTQTTPQTTPQTQPQTQPSATVPASDISYSVTVLDPQGKPLTEQVIVHFMKDGSLAAMQTVNAEGVAQKVLPSADYTISLSFTDASAAVYYDTADLLLTPDKTSLTVVLYNGLKGDYLSITAYSQAIEDHKDYDAYYVGTGFTYVPITAGDRNYLLFTPTQPGMYSFRAEGATIGYYGGTHFVQSMNLAEMLEDGSFTMNITPGMIGDTGGTTTLVLGLDGDMEGCIVSIERIGDHEKSVEEYPWNVYYPSATLSKFTVPEDVILVDFDLTADSDAYTLVYNNEDGYYHLGSEQGPVVYAKLGTATAYLASIETILETSGFGVYFYDEDGNFLRKESYVECLQEYIANMDDGSGVYPLTEDLVYIINQRGNYVGWWDKDSPMYLFRDNNGNPVPGINPEIAWLLFCCYGEEKLPEPTPEPDPAPEPGPKPGEKVVGDPYGSLIERFGTDALSFNAEVPAGKYVTYSLYRVGGTVLTIHAEYAYVIYGSNVYWPVDGVIEVPLESVGMNNGIRVSIGNFGGETENFTVECLYPLGSYMNPVALPMGAFTTVTAEGDQQGYYYSFTAEKDGVLTITFDTMDGALINTLTLYNLSSYVNLVDDNADGSVTLSIEVKAGEEVQIILAAYTKDYEYPSTTITATAVFE